MQFCQITSVCYFCPDPRAFVLFHFYDTVVSGNVFITQHLLTSQSRFCVSNCKNSLMKIKDSSLNPLSAVVTPFRLNLLLYKKSLDGQSVNLTIIALF